MQWRSASHAARVCSAHDRNRRKLAARFELIEDIVAEAVRIAERDGSDTIVKAAVEDALAQRRRRNGRIEDRMQQTIADGTVMIETAGDAVE